MWIYLQALGATRHRSGSARRPLSKPCRPVAGGHVCSVQRTASNSIHRPLPFLGFLIHRSLVSRIGLPEAAFFILADDTEYCLRARAAGAQIVIVGTSHIEHPKSEPYVVTLPFRRLICLRLAPWKRYYDTRNRIFIARRYYGARLYSQTIPAIFIRLMTTLIYEPDRWRQIKAYSAGLADGLLGRDGCRHGQWGIEP